MSGFIMRRNGPLHEWKKGESRSWIEDGFLWKVKSDSQFRKILVCPMSFRRRRATDCICQVSRHRETGRGVSGEPRLTQCRGGWRYMMVSSEEESTDLPLVVARSKRDQTRAIQRHNDFFAGDRIHLHHTCGDAVIIMFSVKRKLRKRPWTVCKSLCRQIRNQVCSDIFSGIYPCLRRLVLGIATCIPIVDTTPTCTRADVHFSRAHITVHNSLILSTLFQCCHIGIGSRWKGSVSRTSQKTLSSLRHVLVSLFGVPFLRFSLVASSLTCSLSRPSASSISLERTRLNPWPSAHWSGMSGCLAHPTPNTGHEPNFCLHKRGAHADQPPWQQPELPAPRRRHHNLHHRGPRRMSTLRSMQQQQAYRSKQSTHWRSSTSCRKYGDLITADHKVLSKYAVVVQDLAAQWIQSYPCKTKTSQETVKNNKSFSSRHTSQKLFIQTIHRNLANLLKIYHGMTALTTSSIRIKWYRWQSRPTSEGRFFSSIATVRTGWRRWSDSMECCCCLRKVQDLQVDGKTLYERRFGEPFKGPIIPFGAEVEYHPISTRDQTRLHQFGKKVLPGIILGYESVAGGIWKGDILIADLEDLENWMHQKFILEESSRKKFWSDKKMMNSYSRSKMVQQNCQEETTNWENPLWGLNQP